MRRRTTIYAWALCLSCSILLTGAAPRASAQSGRVAPTPEPSPTPQAAPPTQPEAAPKPIPVTGRDKYRLVFAPGYDTSTPPVPDAAKKIANLFGRPRYPAFDSFVDELNKAGEQGYRLVSSVRGRLAILEADETRHEYASFVTVSDEEQRKSGFLGTYTQLAKLGYRLASHALFYSYCDAADFEKFKFYETCEYRDFFLREKKTGVERPGSPRLVFSVVRSIFDRGRPPHAEVMTADLREAMSAGYIPTAALSRFEVLIEEATEEDEPAATRPEARIVRSSSFFDNVDNLKGKVNEAAQQGYRLALIKNKVAVMYRREQTPATYVWVEADNKRLEERLAALQAGGAVYRMIYPDSLGRESQFIFEQRQTGDGLRREYRVLRLELQSAEDRKAEKVTTDLTPPSQDAMKELDRLVKEGFVVRDLFIYGYPKSVKGPPGRDKIKLRLERYGILLERVTEASGRQ